MTTDPTLYFKAQQQAQARARAERLALTEDQGDLLERLDPPIHADNLTTPQVTKYLGVSPGTIHALIRIHGEELKAAGYITGKTKQNAARFTRRSILHLALLLRPNASPQSTVIKKALGITVPTPSSSRGRWAGHVVACGHLLDKATELAMSVQEEDPQEVWNMLSGMERWHLQGVVVTLAAMLPLDQPGLFQYLADLGDKIKLSERSQGTARGLASLIPATRSEYEANEL